MRVIGDWAIFRKSDSGSDVLEAIKQAVGRQPRTP
jgi:hypothetical protein